VILTEIQVTINKLTLIIVIGARYHNRFLHPPHPSFETVRHSWALDDLHTSSCVGEKL
jgi:hypothetical protein